MKRIARWQWNVAAGVLLLLFIAVAVMWGRSFITADRWYWPDPAQIYAPRPSTIIYTDGKIPWFLPTDDQIYSIGLAQHGNFVVHLAAGSIQFVIDSPPSELVTQVHSTHGLPPVPFDGHAMPMLKTFTRTVRWSLVGFAHDELFGRTKQSELSGILPRTKTHPLLVRRWIVPYWSLAVSTGIIPLLWLIARLWPARRLAGQCQTCGYDLRATPERCPECGTVPTGRGKSQSFGVGPE